MTVAAASDGDEFDPLLDAARSLGAPPEAWDEAERSGVIGFALGKLRFRHPLVAAAVREMVSSAELRAAHAAIAAALLARQEPARAAWQRAAAAVGADEEIAAALESAAEEFARRSGHLGAARALERAARLTPSAPQRARRLVIAAEAARRAQDDDEADAWAGEALALVDGSEWNYRANVGPASTRGAARSRRRAAATWTSRRARIRRRPPTR